jgi:hypothetical protein
MNRVPPITGLHEKEAYLMSGLQAKTLVAPIDFSNESLAALSTVLDIASAASDVHIVHVIPELNAAEAGVIWQKIDDRARIKHALGKLQSQLSDERYAEVQIHAEVGDPGSCVADLAQRLHADLIEQQNLRWTRPPPFPYLGTSLLPCPWTDLYSTWRSSYCF